MLFLLLLLPLAVQAQTERDYEIAFKGSIPANLGKPIHMPRRDYNPHFQIDAAVDYKTKSRIFIIQADSVYKKLFWRYTYTHDSVRNCRKKTNDDWWCNWMEQHLVDSLPVIDFRINDLVMYSACAQCLAYCRHDEMQNSCHRNACSFRETWFIRPKQNIPAKQ